MRSLWLFSLEIRTILKQVLFLLNSLINNASLVLKIQEHNKEGAIVLVGTEEGALYISLSGFYYVLILFSPLPSFSAHCRATLQINKKRTKEFIQELDMRHIRTSSIKRLFSVRRQHSFDEQVSISRSSDFTEEDIQVSHHHRPTWKCFSYQQILEATNGFCTGFASDSCLPISTFYFVFVKLYLSGNGFT